MILPDFDGFVTLARQAGLVAVSRAFPFDTDTAVTAYARLARPPFSFLLESVTGAETWARYTFLGTEPRSAWRLETGGRVSRWTPAGGWGEPVVVSDPLADLDALLRDRAAAAPPGLPSFFGGAVGYLGYDVARHIERLPDAPPDTLGLPEALLIFTDTILAIDNVYGRAHAIATVDVNGDPGRDELRRRYDDAIARLDRLVDTLRATPPPPPLELRAAPAGLAAGEEPGAGPAALGAGDDPRSSFDRPGFEAAVRRVKEYIVAGDAFQVVLSQRFEAPLEARPFDLYRALRSLNPSPYMYYLELNGLAIAGSSPEVLVRVRDDRVVVRPIAGTRRRGATETEDRAATDELLADPKERAEHLMLVDLGRNDVGRVARYGSVRMAELMGIERYSHVIHMVSQVEGELRATFPAGTVSGAPKVRAMEIIDELEPVRRGPYAGAVGYLAYGGAAMDAAIAIRTLVAVGGRAYIQAGAGIVADSDPAREYEETVAKAGVGLEVLRIVKGAGG